MKGFSSFLAVFSLKGYTQPITPRSSRPVVFCKKLFLKILQNSQENTSVEVTLLVKSHRPDTSNVIEKEAPVEMFCSEIFKKLFITDIIYPLSFHKPPTCKIKMKISQQGRINYLLNFTSDLIDIHGFSFSNKTVLFFKNAWHFLLCKSYQIAQSVLYSVSSTKVLHYIAHGYHLLAV